MNAPGLFEENFFRSIYVTSKERHTYIPLGSWNIDPNKYERLLPFYFSEKQGYLYSGFRAKWYSNETYNYEVYECIDNNELRYSFDKYCDTG